MAVKVSVIIPAHNVADYIVEATESVIRQTLKAIEIIIVDNGSRDGTPQLINELMEKDRRIKAIFQENQGISAARNKGAGLAVGEYLYFFDSDDLLHPQALELLYLKARSMGLELLQFGNDEYVHGIEARPEDQETSGGFLTREISAAKLLEDKALYSVLVWKYLIHRDLWHRLEYGFLEGFTSEDCEMTPRLVVTAQKIGWTPQIFHHYRLRSNSYSRSLIGEDRILGALAVVESLERFYKACRRPELDRGLHRVIANETIVAMSFGMMGDREHRKLARKKVKELMYHFREYGKGKFLLIYILSGISYDFTAYMLKRRHLANNRRFIAQVMQAKREEESA